MLRRILLLAVPFALGACATVAPEPSVSPALSGPAVVSAADPRAAEAGAAMLRQGGSATDAAIATMLALTVVEPQSSGIGGGGFLLHHGADGEIASGSSMPTADPCRSCRQ
jgi:gamma-glutamyltranspeptidase/glutathione hydrolase